MKVTVQAEARGREVLGEVAAESGTNQSRAAWGEVRDEGARDIYRDQITKGLERQVHTLRLHLEG